MENEGLLILAGIAGFFFTLALFAYVYFRGLTLITIYHDQDFEAGAFLRWTYKGRHFEKHATLIVLLAYITCFFLETLAPAISGPVFFALLLIALAVGALRDQKASTRLHASPVDFPRDRKILFVYLALTAAYFATIFSTGDEINTLALTLGFLAFLQAPPIFIIAANFVVRPFLKEKA